MAEDIKLFVKRLYNHDLLGTAAQLSYYLLLSFFPFIIALISIVSSISIDKYKLLSEMSLFIPNYIMDIVYQNTEFFTKRASDIGTISIGFITTIYLSSRGFRALTRQLNRPYHVAEDRSILVTWTMSIVATLLFAGFIVVAVSAYILWENYVNLYFSALAASSLYHILRFVLLFMGLTLVISVFYIAMPNVKLKYHHVLLGASISSIIWILVSTGFEIYITHFSNYANIYGSITGIILILLWLYIVSIAILLGNEINGFFYYKKQDTIQIEAIKKAAEK